MKILKAKNKYWFINNNIYSGILILNNIFIIKSKVLNIKDKANIKSIPFQACEMSAGLNSICEAIEIER